MAESNKARKRQQKAAYHSSEGRRNKARGKPRPPKGSPLRA